VGLQSEPPEQFQRLLFGGSAVVSVNVDERKRDVLERAEMGEEVVRLEDEASFRAARPELLLVAERQRLAMKPDLARVGRLQSGEESEER
jgi:hypothetical protein